MPFVPIANCWKVSLEAVVNVEDTPVVQVFHVLDVGTHTVTQASNIAQAFDDAVADNLNPWPPQWVYEQSVCTDAASSTGPQVAVNSSAPAQGTGGNGFVSGSAALAKLTTALRGRSYRGRSYFMAVEPSATSDVVNATQAAAILSWFSDLNASLLALPQPCSLAVGSKKLGQANQITTFAVEPKLAYQRRRGQR